MARRWVCRHCNEPLAWCLCDGEMVRLHRALDDLEEKHRRLVYAVGSLFEALDDRGCVDDAEEEIVRLRELLPADEAKDV